MKLTIIGGGSVRTPQLIPSLVLRAARMDLREVCLMDIQAEKLELIGSLCQAIAREQDATFEIILTTDAKEAISDADHLITSIRPGYERGRAVDERICFEHGVLGQETTGAAGFAMAMRSAPAILEYARLVEQYAKPDAWLFNFTNPAGLVTQVLHDAGFERVVGICDSANKAQQEVSRFMQIAMHRLQHEVYGLNHLSWTRRVYIDADKQGQNGEEVLQGLLNDENFVQATHMKIFAHGLREWQGTFMNEYLHYYYHQDEVLQALINKDETRGEEIERLTNEMLQEIHGSQDTKERLQIYREIMARRSDTYMAHAHKDTASGEKQESDIDDEGYAGVALACVQAIATGEPHYTGLNIPNKGSITGMADDDVVEVACWITSTGIQAVPIGTIPEQQLNLMRSIKLYEKLASQAIRDRSRDIAIQALAVHPLVASYPLAQKLVDAFLVAHQETIGTWA